MAVPVLDTSLYTTGSLAQRAQFADALVKSCIQHGFVKLVNHGVSEQMVEDLFKYGRKFFEISPEAKQKMQNPSGPDPQRGWSCVGAERSAKLYRTGIGKKDTKAKLSDAREHFDQGSAADIAFPNRWPDEADLPGFRAFMESYYLTLEKVSLQILQALELGLKVPPGSFTNKCLGGASEVRINHYPEIDLKELKNGDVSRIWPHTDLGVITCLFQDDNGGLEMQDRVKCDGSFVPILRESPSEMVINISETFQRWTNGIVKAGVHQVTIPPHMKDLQEGVIPRRFSNAYFMKADRHANVGPVEQFVTEKHPSEYDSMTALQYHQQRLATAYV